MLDQIQGWIAVGAAFAGIIGSYFKSKADIKALSVKQQDEIDRVDDLIEDVDELKEEKVRVSTLLTSMSDMQQESRLDIKMILQQIAGLAARQGKSSEEN